jgi:hypothetical protein
MNRLAFSALVVLTLAGSASAAPSAKQAFDRLKTLAGTWEGTGEGEKVKVLYRVTGGGSALVETQFPETAHEMVTVYHMNGDKLVLTHYCAAHNQPTMGFVPGKDASVLKFKFVSGSNMKATDMHMHNMTMRLLSKDHVASEWEMHANGKPGGSVKFDLHRVKA